MYIQIFILLLIFGCGQKEIGQHTNSIAGEDNPTNIIYILADDLGYGDLGCYGQEKIQTPNIDRLADEGILFTNHYAGSTVCAPSRASLMTGLHTGHCYIRGNARVPLRAEEITVAEVLQKADYKTALIGKWGLGDAGTEGMPLSQGFDYFYGYLNQTRAHNSYPDYLWRNDKRDSLPNTIIMADRGYAKDFGSVSTNKAVYSNDRFTEEALNFIENTKDTTFYVYLAYTIPHANNEYWILDEHGMEVPSLGIYADEDWPAVEKAKAASISLLDAYVGQILDKINELGLDNNTLIIFSSDNGPHAEGKVDPEFFDSNKPYRGIKRDLYNGGVKVPMIARWPNMIKANTVTDHMSAFWDFLPTAAEIAGVSVDTTIDGISFLPTLLGAENQEAHEQLYWEFHERGKAKALRTNEYTLIYLIESDTYELYDAQQDTAEAHNIAAAYPDVMRALIERMDAARSPSSIFTFNTNK